MAQHCTMRCHCHSSTTSGNTNFVLASSRLTSLVFRSKMGFASMADRAELGGLFLLDGGRSFVLSIADFLLLHVYVDLTI